MNISDTNSKHKLSILNTNRFPRLPIEIEQLITYSLRILFIKLISIGKAYIGMHKKKK